MRLATVAGRLALRTPGTRCMYGDATKRRVRGLVSQRRRWIELRGAHRRNQRCDGCSDDDDDGAGGIDWRTDDGPEVRDRGDAAHDACGAKQAQDRGQGRRTNRIADHVSYDSPGRLPE